MAERGKDKIVEIFPTSHKPTNIDSMSEEDDADFEAPWVIDVKSSSGANAFTNILASK